MGEPADSEIQDLYMNHLMGIKWSLDGVCSSFLRGAWKAAKSLYKNYKWTILEYLWTLNWCLCFVLCPWHHVQSDGAPKDALPCRAVKTCFQLMTDEKQILLVHTWHTFRSKYLLFAKVEAIFENYYLEDDDGDGSIQKAVRLRDCDFFYLSIFHSWRL